jgi:hypothetical protein
MLKALRGIEEVPEWRETVKRERTGQTFRVVAKIMACTGGEKNRKNRQLASWLAGRMIGW